MSITIPKQREALAKELHDRKRNIQANNLQQRLDKQGLSRDLTKFFKAVIEALDKTASKITKTIEDLPAILAVLPPPPPEFADPDPFNLATPLPIKPPTNIINVGPLAQEYLNLV